MKTAHQILAEGGYVRSFNGGGSHVHLKELANGWTVSVCNGQACEVSDEDTRIHVNMHRSENAKWARQLLGTDYTASQRRNLRRGFPVGRSFSPPSHIPPHRDWSAETGRGRGLNLNNKSS